MDAYFGYDFETAVHQVTGVFYITIAKLVKFDVYLGYSYDLDF